MVNGLARRYREGESELTPKQEIFATLVANGESLSAAYRQAYRSNGKAETVNNSASRLMTSHKIRMRVDTLVQKLEAGMHRDAIAIRRHVFSSLMKESRNEKAKPGERIQALVALGKIDVVGMFRELSVVEARTERSPEEVEIHERLRDLFREFPAEPSSAPE